MLHAAIGEFALDDAGRVGVREVCLAAERSRQACGGDRNQGRLARLHPDHHRVLPEGCDPGDTRLRHLLRDAHLVTPLLANRAASAE